jgi:predicted Kef-type K+ transport protein
MVRNRQTAGSRRIWALALLALCLGAAVGAFELALAALRALTELLARAQSLAAQARPQIGEVGLVLFFAVVALLVARERDAEPRWWREEPRWWRR